jgi:hypothetical protein
VIHGTNAEKARNRSLGDKTPLVIIPLLITPPVIEIQTIRDVNICIESVIEIQKCRRLLRLISSRDRRSKSSPIIVLQLFL